MSVLSDLEEVKTQQVRLSMMLDEQQKITARQEEQINGERGLSAAIMAHTEEMHGLRRAMYWVGGLIVAGSIGMAFSAFSLVGGGP